MSGKVATTGSDESNDLPIEWQIIKVKRKKMAEKWKRQDLPASRKAVRPKMRTNSILFRPK